jgi:hypothetical protein
MKKGEWRQRYDQQRQQRQQVECDLQELMRICHHEAGHVLVIFALNVHVGRVRVGFGVNGPSSQQQGTAEWRMADGEGEIDLRSKIAICYGGPSADLLFHGRELNPYGSDQQDAISCADKIAAAEGGDWHKILTHE